MSAYDKQLAAARPTLRADEQFDAEGDIVWALTLLATTYDRQTLDRIAEAVGCELVFAPVGRWSA